MGGWVMGGWNSIAPFSALKKHTHTHTTHDFSIRCDEGLTLETSTLKLLTNNKRTSKQRENAVKSKDFNGISRSGDETSEIDRNDSFHSVQTIEYYGEKKCFS